MTGRRDFLRGLVSLPLIGGGIEGGHYFGAGSSYHGHRQGTAMSRAALVLSTVGCDWRSDLEGGAR